MGVGRRDAGFYFTFFDPTVFSRKRLKLLEKIFGYPPNLHTVVTA